VNSGCRPTEGEVKQARHALQQATHLVEEHYAALMEGEDGG